MDNPDDGTNAGTFVAFDGNSTVNGFVFTHNLGRKNTYGIRRDGMTDGIHSIEASVAGNITFERNGIAGCSSSLYDSPTYDNLCPTQAGCIERPKTWTSSCPAETTPGHVVNNFQSGEWLQFTVSVATPGSYTIQLKVSTYKTSGFHLEVDGVNVTGSVPVPSTGSWSNFQLVSAGSVTLSAGHHVLRVFVDQEYFNLDEIQIQ